MRKESRPHTRGTQDMKELVSFLVQVLVLLATVALTWACGGAGDEPEGVPYGFGRYPGTCP